MNLKYDNDIKKFTFSFFKRAEFFVPFRTSLGKDRSNNKAIIEKCITKEYKLLTSTYMFNRQGQIFLNLTVELPKKNEKFIKAQTAFLQLSFTSPIVLRINGINNEISDNYTFLHKRQAIQNSLIRKKKNLKYINGGRGIKNKYKSIDKYKQKGKII